MTGKISFTLPWTPNQFCRGKQTSMTSSKLQVKQKKKTGEHNTEKSPQTKFIMSSEGSTCSRVENKLCSILLHQYYELELSFILCVLQYLRAIKEEHTL